MLVSAGGSSGGRGLASASGIVSPPSPSPPPRDAAFAAPPASPSPECGIEGLPAAGVPHRAAKGSGRCPAARRPPAGFSSGLLPLSPRRSRGFPGRNGGPRRRLRVAARVRGAPLPRRRLPGAHPQPRSPRAASAPGAIGWAAGSRRRPRAFSAEQPMPDCGAASCRFRRRHRAAVIVPALSASGRARPPPRLPSF